MACVKGCNVVTGRCTCVPLRSPSPPGMIRKLPVFRPPGTPRWRSRGRRAPSIGPGLEPTSLPDLPQIEGWRRSGRGRIVVPAQDQVMLADGGTATIRSDPVEIGENDRLTGIANVHYLTGTTATIVVRLEASNDRTTWFELGGFGPSIISDGATDLQTQVVVWAFVRFWLDFSVTAGLGRTCFDIYCHLDHHRHW